MLEVPEYRLDGYDQLLTEDDVVSPSEAKWFRRELEKIAGKNPQGQPILALRWGVTWRNPMSTNPDSIKYVDCVHGGKELGERRWIVEIWRSPEFLAHSGRYITTTIQDTDGTKLLKEIQSEGCYDYWLRLERANLTYHPLDNEALRAVQVVWKYEQMSPSERNAFERADAELERRQMILAQRQQSGRAPQFSSGVILPAHLR